MKENMDYQIRGNESKMLTDSQMKYIKSILLILCVTFLFSCNVENHEKSDMMDEILTQHKNYIYSHHPWVLSMAGGVYLKKSRGFQ